jgi:hypothetical protein
VYLFVNITKVWSLFRDFILLFLRGKSGKPHRENPFFASARASLADLRMRICYQNNGGSNISKRENTANFGGIIFAIHAWQKCMSKRQRASISLLFILFSTKFPINIEHVILTNRMFFVFRIATFLAGKWRHKLAAKKLTVSYC